MNTISFIDTEVDPKSKRTLDLGGVKQNGQRFHNTSVSAFIEFLKGTLYVCGHNLLKHEQLLMLTFSRAAATEFKKRLL